MSQPCLLCRGNSTHVLERLATRDLDRLWRLRLGRPVLGRGWPDELALRECAGCGLLFFDPPLAGGDGFYRTLAERIRFYYQDDKPEFAWARGKIGEEDEVLEIGAGRGGFARQLECRRYTGLELSAAAITQAGACGVPLIRESIEDHAARHPESYDVVCAFQVLEHVADARAFVTAAAACLRPRGHMILSVPAEESYLARLPNAALNLPPHHVSRWTRRALGSLAGLFGLELLALEQEPLCAAHEAGVAAIRRLDYASVVAAEALRRAVGRRWRSIDFSLAGRLLGVAAGWGGRLFASGLGDARRQPAGHTVSVLYRKLPQAVILTPTGEDAA